MAELTDVQRRVLRFIKAWISDFGWAPSMKEICSQFGWASTHTAHGHLSQLARKGFIIRQQRASRAIKVTEAGRRAV